MHAIKKELELILQLKDLDVEKRKELESRNDVLSTDITNLKNELMELNSKLAKYIEERDTIEQKTKDELAFQALQHRMADMFIECQLARSIVVMAAMKLDSSADQREKTKAVSAAKSRVGKAIRRVSQEAVQIHGGIGVTNELDVGHYFKRATALSLLFVLLTLRSRIVRADAMDQVLGGRGAGTGQPGKEELEYRQ